MPVLLTFILCLFTTGCSTSEDDTSTKGFRFCVQMPKSIEVETKVDLGGDSSEKTAIQNAWIVQYNSNGQLLHCIYIDKGFKVDDTGYLVTITTGNETFTKMTSNFYFILNGGESLLNGFDTLKDNSKDVLLKKTSTMPNEGGIPTISGRPLLLTAGPTSYTEEKEAEKVILVSRVYRAFAKFSLTINFLGANDLFVVKEATVTNIPKEMALYAGGGSNNNYPATVDIYSTPIQLSGVSTNSTANFYMPENIRGIGNSSTFQGKNVASNGPGGNLDGCTYLTLKGKYYYDKTQSGGNYVQAPIDVEYRFYLGSNLTNDYNIRRDHHYNLTINLKGANSADLRVTITNGNVAVFDEVETITNTVDF